MQKEKLPKGLIGMLLIMVLGALPPMFDATIVNIAVNSLAKEFATTFAIMQWIVTGYTLALGIAVPFSGWMMKKFDGKTVFMGALGLFLAASLLSGFSWSIAVLIAFRVLQGFAAGLLIPTLTAMVAQAAGPENMGRLMSIVGIPIVFGPIIGPVIGGLILQHLTWHWLFFVNLPIGIIALVLMQWKLPRFAPMDPQARLDLPGIALLAVLSGAVIFGVTEIRTPGAEPAGITALCAGAAALVGYVLYANTRGEQALIPLDLFRTRNFTASFFSLFLAGFATNGPMLLFPMLFQNVRGLNVITAALWLVPQGVGMLLMRPLIGKWTDQFGARLVVLPAIAVTILGTLPFVFFGEATSQWLIWAVLLVRGMGVGGVTIPAMSDSYVGLSKQQVPAASVSTRIVQNVGAAFGSAILATVVSSALGAQAATAANEASAYHAGFLTSLVFMVVSILPALFLTNKRKADSPPRPV